MKILLVFFLVALGGTFLSPFFSDAAGLIPCGACNADLDASGECPAEQKQPACRPCHIFALVNNVITFLLIPSSSNGGFAIVLVIAALLFGLGGFMLFAAAGNMARLEQGKKIIAATAIGLFIIYSSWVILGILLSSLGVLSWTGLGNWWEITC